jgi:hypothetical protein
MLAAIRQEQEEFEKLVCELAMNEQEELTKQAEKARDEKVIRESRQRRSHASPSASDENETRNTGGWGGSE